MCSSYSSMTSLLRAGFLTVLRCEMARCWKFAALFDLFIMVISIGTLPSIPNNQIGAVGRLVED